MKLTITEKAKTYMNQKSIDTITFKKLVKSRG